MNASNHRLKSVAKFYDRLQVYQTVHGTRGHSVYALVYWQTRFSCLTASKMIIQTLFSLLLTGFPSRPVTSSFLKGRGGRNHSLFASGWRGQKAQKGLHSGPTFTFKENESRIASQPNKGGKRIGELGGKLTWKLEATYKLVPWKRRRKLELINSLFWPDYFLSNSQSVASYVSKGSLLVTLTIQSTGFRFEGENNDSMYEPGENNSALTFALRASDRSRKGGETTPGIWGKPSWQSSFEFEKKTFFSRMPHACVTWRKIFDSYGASCQNHHYPATIIPFKVNLPLWDKTDQARIIAVDFCSIYRCLFVFSHYIVFIFFSLFWDIFYMTIGIFWIFSYVNRSTRRIVDILFFANFVNGRYDLIGPVSRLFSF